jgi:hypothetical protein
MWRQLVIRASIETAWLAAMWLCLPQTRPWGHRTAATTTPALLVAHGQKVLLLVYGVFHLPSVIVGKFFNLFDISDVRPADFFLLGAIMLPFHVADILMGPLS